MILLPFTSTAQQKDSTIIEAITDSVVAKDVTRTTALEGILKENKFLNTQTTAQVFVQTGRKQTRAFNIYFYVILGLVLFYALCFFFFRKYVSDVFRLYLNTSLNKSQITDQLRQDELPSLFSNIIFIVGMALFATQIIFPKTGNELSKLEYLGYISILLSVIYLVKYFSLKFTGWVSSFSTQAGLYIFIVFVVNKVLGFIILPVAVIVALGSNAVKQPAVIVGIIVILTLLLTRFVKAFNIIKSNAKIQILHFVIFIIAIEVLPLLLLFKAGKMFLINLS